MLLSLTGGQWALLQSAAWAGMLVSRVRTEHLPQAIATTFDGDHPCPLCKAVSSARKSEKKSEVDVKLPRVEFTTDDQLIELTDLPDPRHIVNSPNEFADSIVFPPPVRPPRTIPA
jgi:hypothetical protein